MFRTTTFLLLALPALSGCALTVKTFFEPVGRLGAASDARPLVDTPDDVDVYMRSAPDGFTLAENEVSVEEGFRHEVRGLIRVGYGGGSCNYGSLGQKDLIKEIQNKAHGVGANAVIYLNSEWTEGTAGYQRCTPGDPDPTYASGWAVVVAN